jgi:hypothetical protein
MTAVHGTTFSGSTRYPSELNFDPVICGEYTVVATDNGLTILRASGQELMVSVHLEGRPLAPPVLCEDGSFAVRLPFQRVQVGNWKTGVTSPPLNRVLGEIVSDGQTIFVVTREATGGAIHGFGGGNRLWQNSLDSCPISQPRIEGGRLLVALRDGRTVSVDPSTGCREERFEHEVLPRDRQLSEPFRGTTMGVRGTDRSKARYDVGDQRDDNSSSSDTESDSAVNAYSHVREELDSLSYVRDMLDPLDYAKNILD